MGLAATFRSGEVAPQAMPGPKHVEQSAWQCREGSAETPAKKEGEMFRYAGLVLDPDGKPVAGAKLHLAYWRDQGPARTEVRGTTDAQGRFGFTVTKRDFPDTDEEQPWTWAQVVATAEGFGLGWASAFDKNGKTLDPPGLTIRLAKDDVPIEGRIVDLEGRAVARCDDSPAKDTRAGTRRPLGLDRRDEEQSGRFHHDRTNLPDAHDPGRGRGAVRAVHVRRQGTVLDPGHRPGAGDRAGDLGTDDPDQGGQRPDPDRRPVPGRIAETSQTRTGESYSITEHRFTHAAAPTKPVISLVKDRDTGKPLAGVRIPHFNKTAEFPVTAFTRTASRRPPTGMVAIGWSASPRGTATTSSSSRRRVSPISPAGLDIPDSPGLDPAIVNIGLKQGVVIEGTGDRQGHRHAAQDGRSSTTPFAIIPTWPKAPGFDRSHMSGAVTQTEH